MDIAQEHCGNDAAYVIYHKHQHILQSLTSVRSINKNISSHVFNLKLLTFKANASISVEKQYETL